jgi:hypothetical protein
MNRTRISALVTTRAGGAAAAAALTGCASSGPARPGAPGRDRQRGRPPRSAHRGRDRGGQRHGLRDARRAAGLKI